MRKFYSGNEQTFLSFPIPKKSLEKRLKPVIECLAKKQSVAYLGVYGSGKSLHWQLVLSDQKLFKNLLAPLNDSHFVYLNSSLCQKTNPEIFARLTLAQLIDSSQDITSQNARQECKHILSSDDIFLITKHCQDLIKIILSQKSRVIFVIDYFEKIANANPDILLAGFLQNLWQIDRVSPVEKVSFLILSEPKPFFSPYSNFLSEIKKIIGENIVLSPILNKEESFYSYYRHSKIRNYNLDKKVAQALWQIVGGLGSTFRFATQILERLPKNADKKSIERILLSHESILECAKSFFDSLPEKEVESLKNFLSNGKIPKPQSILWPLSIIQKKGNKSFVFGKVAHLILDKSSPKTDFGGISLKEELTNQEFNLLNFFLQNPNQMISKDQVAEVLWGKDFYNKYSDWAINKAVARLRKKLQRENTSSQLLTFKGRGYKFISKQKYD